MDSTTLVNVGLIAIFIVVIVLIYYNVRASKRYLPGDRQQEQAFKAWLKEHGYAADNFHFYRGTGAAYSNRDDRLALFRNNSPAFHRKDELSSIRSHEEVTGRMVAAAPGVVREVSTTLYALDIALQNDGRPASKIMFSSSKERNAWETRLRNCISAQIG